MNLKNTLSHKIHECNLYERNISDRFDGLFCRFADEKGGCILNCTHQFGKGDCVYRKDEETGEIRPI
jgi:hypothetical protein